MPIRIDRVGANGKDEEIAWLCDEVWEMPIQLKVLEQWALENRSKLPVGSYVADLGFSPRPGAAGGGGIVGRELMEALLEMHMELYLSEYPPELE